MSTYHKPASKFLQAKATKDFAEQGPGSNIRPQHQPAVSSRLKEANAPPSTSIKDLEAQRSKKQVTEEEPRHFTTKVTDVFKTRRIFAALGVSIVVMLLWVIPYALYRSSRKQE